MRLLSHKDTRALLFIILSNIYQKPWCSASVPVSHPELSRVLRPSLPTQLLPFLPCLHFECVDPHNLSQTEEYSSSLAKKTIRKPTHHGEWSSRARTAGGRLWTSHWVTLALTEYCLTVLLWPNIPFPQPLNGYPSVCHSPENIIHLGLKLWALGSYNGWALGSCPVGYMEANLTMNFILKNKLKNK